MYKSGVWIFEVWRILCVLSVCGSFLSPAVLATSIVRRFSDTIGGKIKALSEFRVVGGKRVCQTNVFFDRFLKTCLAALLQQPAEADEGGCDAAGGVEGAHLPPKGPCYDSQVAAATTATRQQVRYRID